jgi:hypothetical protein
MSSYDRNWSQSFQTGRKMGLILYGSFCFGGIADRPPGLP